MDKVRNLKTNICECGCELTVADMTGRFIPLSKSDKPLDFYGGRVSGFANGTCSNCKKEYLLYLNSYNGTLNVMDMEIMKKDTESKPSKSKATKTKAETVKKTEEVKGDKDGDKKEIQKSDN